MMDGKTPIESPDESLERLEASIQEALNRLIDGGRIADSHRERADEFRRRLEALKQRLGTNRDASDRVKLAPDSKSHLDLLSWDFKRWTAEIDDEFANRSGKPDGLNG